MISIPGTALRFSKPDMSGSFESVGDVLGKQAGEIHDFITNSFSGERDYNRQVELSDRVNAFTASESEKARNFNARQAQLQRDFEERMSNSAYSRAFADMRKNGINPYAMLGSASTPSGAVASSPSGRGASATAIPSGKALASLLGNVVASAFQYAGRALAIRNMPIQKYHSKRLTFDSEGNSTGGYLDFYD